MTSLSDFAEHLRSIFGPLHTKPGTGQLPEISALSSRLESILSKATNKIDGLPAVTVAPSDAAMFATAAVEMWQRAVHSYLISASLTEASPVWSSVSGYYSSHYSVRALAHLLGCFQLYSKQKIVRIATSSKKQVCTFEKKGSTDREHKAYWRIVAESAPFRGDPLFTINPSDTEPSDVAHRDRANYADHIGNYPYFRPLNQAALEVRVSQIARMTFDVPPIPRRSKFPDVNSVQIVAYHRLVRFRRVLDDHLSTKNRFWNAHRNPAWATSLNFQIAQQGGISSFAGQ